MQNDDWYETCNRVLAQRSTQSRLCLPGLGRQDKLQVSYCQTCFHLSNLFLSLFFSDSPLPVSSRVCFVKFHDPDSAVVAQHLTNTVFVDRALIVVPYAEGLCIV